MAWTGFIAGELSAMVMVVSNTPDVAEEIAKLESRLGALKRQRDEANRACAGIDVGPEASSHDSATTLRRQQHLRRGIIPYLRDYNWMVILTGPVIYGTFIALLILDLALTVYQAICFPVYRIEKVKRRDYIVIDRHQLAYLNVLEKLNCAFCGYANGLLAYGLEIASRTERFWCPIKHAAQTRGKLARTDAFVDYSDGAAYRVLQRENAAATKHGCGGGHCDGCGS